MLLFSRIQINSIWLNLICFLNVKNKQMICCSYGYILFFLKLIIKLKGLIDFSLHILVVKNESFKDLRYLNVTPPTATYAQVPLMIQSYETGV